MKLYTDTEIYTLIYNVTCKRDLQEICDYLPKYKKRYTIWQLKNWVEDIKLIRYSLKLS